MALKAWYRVITPREDLREGKPLDASEFAVHLDQVRDRRAPEVYQKPEQFFEHTYLTRNLTGLAAEVIRRLSGEKTETSAVFNLATQFGGGKTHALTLLYHLAKHGPDANSWHGVRKLLDASGMSSVPRAEVAVFVGTEFDSITGRGGDDGTPLRKTPWGEIAFQLGGEEAFEVVAEHDRQAVAPSSEVIRKFLPRDRPALILMDELMNYVNRSRRIGMEGQLYSFLHNLSEEARGNDNVVLVVSIPASELEMTAEDQSDFERLQKLLDRLGKAVVISAESETSEIVRRRLFEWDNKSITQEGRVLLPKDAVQTCNEYARWVIDNRNQLPQWFPIDSAREAFADTYPFHPVLLSVFERKWQALPRFQRTRGVLRMLALWVSRAYQDGFKRAHRDALIGLGTAPLEDALFRSALFEQLGEHRLEIAVATDIAGRRDSHAVRLDNEAVETIRKSRMHQKVATAMFFESNGGQMRTDATVPEIRMAVAEPGLDIGNVETALEALSATCYFLYVDRNRYRFSLSPNLNKLLADRRASIQPPRIQEQIRDEVKKVFSEGSAVELVFFPDKSSQIPDRAALTLAILAPEISMQDESRVMRQVETMTREHGASSRTFKSAVIWCAAEGDAALTDEARKLLAWEDIDDEKEQLRLDDDQKRQLSESVRRARRDLKESVWRAYKNVLLLGKDNKIRRVDLGLIHSSSADNIVSLVISRLRQDGDVEKEISPNFLVRNWPPAFKEWSTKSVRDAFFASPQFPRLLSSDAVKETIARGVSNGILAYVGKSSAGYEPFNFEQEMGPADVEISDDVFIVTAEEARRHIEPPRLTSLVTSPQQVRIEPGKRQAFIVKGLDQHGQNMVVEEIEWSATGGIIGQDGVFVAGNEEGNYIITARADGVSGNASVTVAARGGPVDGPIKGGTEPSRLSWTGDIPPRQWMNFYTKVLVKYANEKGLKLTLNFVVTSEGSISPQKIEETKIALRELGLDDDVRSG